MNYNNLLLKVSKEYKCVDCNYISRNKTNFAKHLLTRKHKNTIIYNEKLQKVPTTEKYICHCGKCYPYRASLYNHKKRCKFNKCQEMEDISSNSLINSDEQIDYKSMIMKLLDENAEFKNLLIKQQNHIGELIPKVGNNNTSIKNNNEDAIALLNRQGGLPSPINVEFIGNNNDDTTNLSSVKIS